VRSGRRQLAKILSAEVAGALGVNINDAGIDIIGPTLDDKANPPKLAEFLLIMLAPRRRAEHMIGDMDEHFTRECKEFGRDRAVRRYWARTFWSLWPLLWRAIGRAVKGGVVIAAARRLTGL
jgi:hypothetical protein